MKLQDKKFNSSNDSGEKELAQLLIWDHVEDMSRAGFNGVEESLVATWRASALKYGKYKLFLNFLDKAYNIFFTVSDKFKNKEKKKILFAGNKHGSLMLAAKRKYEVEMIAVGVKDRLFAIKHFIKYNSYSDLSELVYDYLIKKDRVFICKFADEIEKRIKETGADYIVLWNNVFPKEIAIITAARKLDIATLEVQEGIYDLFFPTIKIGQPTDCILVWGKYFKDLYINNSNRNPEGIYVLGYPIPAKKINIAENKNNDYAVYYFGPNLESYDKKFLNFKIETVKKLNKICAELGLKFIYRPHPGDNRPLLKEKMPEVCFSPKNEKAEDSVSKGDIFISLNSTLLVESFMLGKICFQLMNYPIGTDNFEELGACDKSFKTIEDLEKHLIKLASTPDIKEPKRKFNNDYIETGYNPGERFLEILDDIGENKRKNFI